MGPNKAFFILIISFIISLFGLTTVLVKSVPLVLSHAVYVCQQTFSNILFTISHSVPFLAAIFAMAIFIVGLLTLTIQLLQTRAYVKKNLKKRALLPMSLKQITSELKIKGKIDIVKDNNKLSFCYGIIKPRICISTGLIKALNPGELRAVVLHESYHLKNHDPFKIILAKTASLMFFFIPLFREMQRHYALSKEIAADHVVIQNNHKTLLLSALSKLLINNQPRFVGVAALASVEDLEKRIMYLTKQKVNIKFAPSLVSVTLSGFILLFFLLLLNTPVYAVKMDGEIMKHSLFICPFGDSCTLVCKAEKETNYTKNLLYTPMTEKR